MKILFWVVFGLVLIVYWAKACLVCTSLNEGLILLLQSQFVADFPSYVLVLISFFFFHTFCKFPKGSLLLFSDFVDFFGFNGFIYVIVVHILTGPQHDNAFILYFSYLLLQRCAFTWCGYVVSSINPINIIKQLIIDS